MQNDEYVYRFFLKIESGKTFCRVSYFSIVLFDSATTSQSETLPGNRDNVCPYEQNKIIWLVEMFPR